MKKLIFLAVLALHVGATAQTPKTTKTETKVLVTANGQKYHTRPECQYVKGKETRQVSKTEAEKHGLSCCAKCAKSGESKQTKSNNFTWAK